MRESILNALFTVVKGITVAKGYAIDVKFISRQFTPITKVPSVGFPAVLIEDDGPETIQLKSSGFANVSFEVSLIGYVRSKDSISTSLNELDTELKKAIAADPTLGGTVARVTIMPYKDRSGSQFAAEGLPYGYFERPIKIQYEGRAIDGF